MSVVQRYPLRDVRELRTTFVGSRVFIAVHSGDRCSSGPLAMPVEDLPVLLLALEDLAEALIEAEQHASGAPTGGDGADVDAEPESPATDEPDGEEGSQ